MDTKAYLSRKSEVVFEFLNTNRNGLLTHEQLMFFPKKVAEMGNSDVAKKAERIYTDYFNKMCSVLGKRSQGTTITKSEFVKANGALRSTSWFRNVFLESVADLYFDSVDHSRDGVICVKEWRELYRARGIADEQFIQSTFTKMDENGDGVIQRSEFKNAFIQFGIGEDQDKDFSFLYDMGVSKTS